MDHMDEQTHECVDDVENTEEADSRDKVIQDIRTGLVFKLIEQLGSDFITS